MIEILVSGHPLALPDSLSLTLEQAAPWADPSNITSDIVWTFDIPAEPNALLLDNAQAVIVSHHRRYSCQLFFASQLIASGYLYIQETTDEQQLSCGITFNPFQVGWSDAPLAHTIQEPDVEIATSLANYKDRWRAFLASTLEPDSDIKFFLLADNKVSIDSHGYFRNRRSPLQARDVQNIFISYLNRLFVDSRGYIIDKDKRLPLVSADVQGLRIFNDAVGSNEGQKFNGYFFLPALRLTHILRLLFRHSGISAFGSFLSSKDISRLFIQSLCAMDGDRWQYPDHDHISLSNSTPHGLDDNKACRTFSVGSSTANYFDNSGTVEPPQLSLHLYLPVDDIARNIPSTWHSFDFYDEAYFLLISTIDLPIEDIPRDRYKTTFDFEPNRHYAWGSIDGGYLDSRAVFTPNLKADLIQLTPTKGNPLPDPLFVEDKGMEVTVNADTSFLFRFVREDRLRLRIVKARVYSTQSAYIITPDNQPGYPRLATWDTAISGDARDTYSRLENIQVVDSDTPSNIFARYFRLSQHLPDLTNSQLLSSLCQFFALAPWIGSDSQIQLSFFSDVFSAQSVVIDSLVTSVRKQYADQRQYTYSVSYTDSSRDIPQTSKLDPVDSFGHLPSAANNHGRYCLVEAENRFYHSVRSSDDDTYYWEPASANDAVLTVGSGDEATDIRPDITIPLMRTVDAAYTHKYLCDMAVDITSPLLSDNFDGKFPLVLNQYRGRRTLALNNSGSTLLTEYQSAAIEYANPTNLNPDGTVDTDFISLTPTGTRSVGELWQQPYLDFLANKEDVEFTAMLPASAFFTLLQLMRPQHEPNSRQVRWITYRNQRYLPSRIVYTLTSSEYVRATITAHRQPDPPASP